ncbi:MAG: TRAP transporter substrate-binding protein [Alphaproteobacteria bacterium]|nr:TRAP transporter substrate-binding protein [Alphaproteobacteria bacterium]
MRIRGMIRGALAIGVAGTMALGVATAASAQDKRVRLQLSSTYPSSLAQLGTLGVNMTKKLSRASGGTIDMRFTEPGALVPALQVFDSISTGAVDAGWSTPGYWTGKDTTFALFSAVPFGPGAGEYLGWIYYGGGRELQNEMYAKYNIISLPCGIIAPEASGWFRKEIKTVDDLKGLKMRFFGLGAKVMEKLGVSTQLIAGGEIFQALQLGTIDATEFSMPAIDLSLGFHQVAKHYYFPGWHQQSTMFDLMLSQKKWAEMSESQKAITEMVCGDNIREGLAEGEAIQVKALQELRSKGVQIHTWSPEILAAMEKAWNEVVAEELGKNENFKKVWASYSAFRENYKIWKDIGYLK